MIDYLAAVVEFHRLYGQPVGDFTKPAALDRARMDLRTGLVSEEYIEVVDEILPALAGGSVDVARLAKELADLIYVAVGFCVEMGVDINQVFFEVHQSNMSKLDDNGLPVFREDGKVLKTDNYYPPDVEGVLAEQGSQIRWRAF